MSELSATAERLRLVKDACIDFITLWAVDRMLDESRMSDRIHLDILHSADQSQIGCSFLHLPRRMDD